MTVLAVVDKQDDAVVVWHVQTSAGGPSASGILSGAWILGPGNVDPARLDDLLADATVLPAEGDGLTLEQIRQAIDEALTEITAAATAAKDANASLTLPRFTAPGTPDPATLADAYRGEPVARTAWTWAMAAAELVESWHAIEGQRRSRKYLQETFGAEIRPLPLP